MATLGQTPSGLAPRDDLPTAQPLQLFVCSRPGLADTIAERTTTALRPLLTPTLTPQPNTR